MTFYCFHNGKRYELPESMKFLSKYQQDDGRLILSELKLIEIINRNNTRTTYSVFVGVIDATESKKIIIYGEYDNSSNQCPFKYGSSFHYIEVKASDMINYECIWTSDSDILLHTCKNSCVIVLKSEVIIFSIDPDFLEDIDDPWFDVDDVWFFPDLDHSYLSVKHVKYQQEITNLPIHCCHHHLSKTSVLKIEQMNDCFDILIDLCFTCVCRYSSMEERKKHLKTTNRITISVMNGKLTITCDMNTTAYVHYVSGEYNDFPTMSKDKRRHVFNPNPITIDLFPEEDKEDD